MKTFRHALGHVAGQTMTVGELKQKLAEYPDDMPVMAEWEEVQAYIEKDYFWVEHTHKGHPDDACDVLIISVNEY